jgi:hypothetical protein
MDTFTRETNRKGGGIKVLPARESGRRLKKPGAMLQRILSIGEVLEFGPARVISHKILIFNTVRVFKEYPVFRVHRIYRFICRLSCTIRWERPKTVPKSGIPVTPFTFHVILNSFSIN